MNERATGKETNLNTQATATPTDVTFKTARRVNQALTARLEKRVLQWMAERAPGWVTSDRLTLLGLGAQIGAGVCYALTRFDRRALLLVIVCLALNWLGDSLDGTLARVRRQERPRYGFYVDHMVDIFGSAALMCGLGCSGLLHWPMAMAMLIAFLVLSSESYLATYTLSCFKLSQGMFGPTEIRILLVDGQPGGAAESVFDTVRAQNAAVRFGRRDCRDWHGGDGADRDRAPHSATLPSGAAAVSTLARWCKFNVVGAMGMVVQLAALAVLNKCCGGPLFGCDGRGARGDAGAQLCVAPALHMARPTRWLGAAGQDLALSSFKRNGFDDGEPCADAHPGAWGAHPGGCVERNRDSGLLACEFLPGKPLGVCGEGIGWKSAVSTPVLLSQHCEMTVQVNVIQSTSCDANEIYPTSRQRKA